MTLPKDNEQIFASKYSMILPSKDDFMKIVQEEKEKNSLSLDKERGWGEFDI